MARYTPGLIADPKLFEEFSKIAQAMETADPFLFLDTLYAAPKKYREGMICKADGTTWNPGSGAGVYCFRAGSWRFLG